MFRLSLVDHETLCDDLKRFISALLPHENGDSSLFSTVLGRVIRLIKVEEMELEYHLIFKTAVELEKIYFQVNSTPVFNRDVLYSTLVSNMYDVVKQDGIGVKRMLERNGLPTNLAVESTVKEAMNRLMTDTLELYDEAFAMGISPQDVIGFEVSLKSNYIQAVGTEVIRAQAYIFNAENELNSHLYEGWREFLKGKHFIGALGWKDFIGYVSSALELRLRDASEDRSPLHSVEEAELLRQEAISLSEVIAEYGIPPIDLRKQIVRCNYTVLIGKRGLGKTTIACNFLVNVFMAGHKVLMINEETKKSLVIFEYLLPIYIYKRFGFYATTQQILGTDEIGGCSSEEIATRKKMIQMAIIDFTESGRFMYVRSINAWHAYQELAQIHNEFAFDYCVIDHTLSMSGGGNTTERLEVMSKGIKTFKNEFGKHVLLLSHTSPKANKVKNAADAEGLTKYASQIEGDADDIFYAYDTELLEARGLLAYQQTKGRGAEKEITPVYLTKVFAYKIIKYDAQVQLGFSDNSDILGEVSCDDDDDEDYEDDI